MKMCDLSTGAARLEMAQETLQRARSQVAEQWKDQAHRQFEENYLLPMEPKLIRALHAIRLLQETLAQAERSCGPL